MLFVAMVIDCEAVAERLIEARTVPSAAAGCASRTASGGWVREVGGGTGTYFDLASVTKPMTALAIARSGSLRVQPLGRALPTVAGTASADVSLELLLAHRAGLEAHVPLFEPLTRGLAVDRQRALLRAADARRIDACGAAPAAGFAPVYSDLGYILAGAALAHHAGTRDAGDAIGRYVVAPLQREDTLGTARSLAARGRTLALLAAPTEIVAWRGGEVRGRVHDENAWALTGLGGSGHAGMFGTVDAVLDFGCAVLDALRDEPELAWLIAERPGGTLRAGFDGKSAEGSSAGPTMGARSFGHLGFTGTSLWFDPEAETVVVLLTNRVHPTRENVALRAARPDAHDALFFRAKELRG